MRVVYVAGPYSAPEAWEREQNVRRAEELAFLLMTLVDLPVAVICVHSQARYWFGAVDEDDAMEADKELLRRSDDVVLAERWQWSKGTHAEILLAAELGKPIYEDLTSYMMQRPTPPEALIARFDEPEELPF